MATDRAILKQAQVGQLNSLASSTANAVSTIASAHTRAYCWTKAGVENSSNNVGETAMFVVNRAGVVKTVKWVTNVTATAAGADGYVITVAKRTGSGAAVPVASWNTSSDAQGTVTTLMPASLSVVTSSDSTVAAADVLTFKCIKNGAGLAAGYGGIVVDIEEV